MWDGEELEVISLLVKLIEIPITRFPITAFFLRAIFCGSPKAVIISLVFLLFPNVLCYATVAQTS